MTFTEAIKAADYRSPAWYEARRKVVTASEIPIILGLSTWGSAFDLWWNKRTGEDSQPESKAMKRGRRLESLIIEDFTDAHPEFAVSPVGLCVRDECPWQAATPDGLVHEAVGYHEEADEYEVVPVAALEAKSDADRSAWGEPGTDEIPVAYRCQVLWQMDVLGLPVAYVPMWLGTEYREYVVEYDPADVELMREAAQEFLASIEADVQPDIDSHVATTRRLKHLHPELSDDEIPVPATLVRQYQIARRLKKAAEDRMRLAENRVRHLIGPAHKAVIDETGKTFSHTLSDVKERTQIVKAHTRDQINFPRKDIA